MPSLAECLIDDLNTLRLHTNRDNLREQFDKANEVVQAYSDEVTGALPYAYIPMPYVVAVGGHPWLDLCWAIGAPYPYPELETGRMMRRTVKARYPIFHDLGDGRGSQLVAHLREPQTFEDLEDAEAFAAVLTQGHLQVRAQKT